MHELRIANTLKLKDSSFVIFLVLPAGIEPTFRASEARVLPLYYGSIEKSIVKKEEKAMKPLLLVKVLFITRV